MSYKEVGAYLEQKAAFGSWVYYSDVAKRFGLPENMSAWDSHELSSIFDDLDHEDFRLGRPFRTALVVTKVKETKMPGIGFFKIMNKLRGTSMLISDREAVWISEFNRVITYPY